MFDLWLTKEVNPSWVKIIAALEKMSEASLVSQPEREITAAIQ